MTISIPDLSLVVLVGASGSGKSTFAARHFSGGEVVSSDFCRFLVADDANDQDATKPAFELLHTIAGKRLEGGRLTVVDATNVQREARAPLVALAREHHVLPVAVVLDVPERICRERNEARADRQLPGRAVRRQHDQLRRSIKALNKEGFRRVFVLRGTDEIEAATVERERRWTDRRDEHGPFDIIGDVHGCADELVELLGALGYEVAPDRSTAAHPQGRRAFFVGDLVDRGPDIVGVLRLAMGMVAAGSALCVPGNHETKLLRVLGGRKVTVGHGLAETLAQLEGCDDGFRAELVAFLDGLVSHAVLDDGRLVVAHAGLPEHLHNRSSGHVRSFALYGQTTGETDEYGLPVRYPWAEDYRGRALVVYGHTPVAEPEWVNNTICVDTGCVFGGRLTALRYPEKELRSVPAHRVHYEPTKPLVIPEVVRPPGLLDVADVLGKRIIDTTLLSRVTIREENATAALEVMSRFAIDPRWLVYLPPTMAPTATSARPDLLEHPDEALADFAREGVATVIGEEKHMGSRAVLVVCRDPAVAVRRFGVEHDHGGVIHTRTGRPFFGAGDAGVEEELLGRVRGAIGAAGLWDELATDWLVLDAELLPWNAKAAELLRDRYAPVAIAGRADAGRAVELLAAAAARGVAVDDLATRVATRVTDIEGFAAAYRRYCWPVDGPGDLRIAPFAVLAGEGAVHLRRDHRWHLDIARRLAAVSDGLVTVTPHVEVDVADPDSRARAVAAWEDLTGRGGEGMVFKPLDPVGRGRRGIVQPGIKCRGREYLRIVYGPEYTAEEHLVRLRQRGLGHKRSLALREFALGVEALDRFVAGEPLHRVHECVFGVLALESEPVDPRLTDRSVSCADWSVRRRR